MPSFSVFFFLGEKRVPMKGGTGTENQKDTLTTGSFSGRMVLIKSPYEKKKKAHMDAKDLGTDSHNTTCVHFEDHWGRA